MTDINTLVMESFTISELEMSSASHWSGNLVLVNENTIAFNVGKENSTTGLVEIEFNKSLKDVKIGESIEGKITDRTKYIAFEALQNTSIQESMFEASGAITFEHGIDADFTTSLLPGIRYNICEKSAFPGATVLMTRLK